MSQIYQCNVLKNFGCVRFKKILWSLYHVLTIIIKERRRYVTKVTKSNPVWLRKEILALVTWGTSHHKLPWLWVFFFSTSTLCITCIGENIFFCHLTLQLTSTPRSPKRSWTMKYIISSTVFSWHEQNKIELRRKGFLWQNESIFQFSVRKTRWASNRPNKRTRPSRLLSTRGTKASFWDKVEGFMGRTGGFVCKRYHWDRCTQ